MSRYLSEEGLQDAAALDAAALDAATIAAMKTTRLVLNDIAQERVHQDDKWGGPVHDDKYTVGVFTGYIRAKTDKAGTEAYNGDALETRRRLVQVAALAVAAIEMLDRKVGG